MPWSWTLRQASDAVEVDEEEESVGSFRKTRSWRRFLTDALLSARARTIFLQAIVWAVACCCFCVFFGLKTCEWVLLHHLLEGQQIPKHEADSTSFFGRHCGYYSEKECGLTRTLRAAYAELTRISGVNLCPILACNKNRNYETLRELNMAMENP